LQRTQSRLKHRFCITQYVVVPEPDHSQAASFERTGPCGIGFFGVLAAVQFDDELGGTAVEVEDIGRIRMLSAESEATESCSAQMEPELAFRIRHAPTQAARLIEACGRQRWAAMLGHPIGSRHFSLPAALGLESAL
jgi:hypothetical protein